MNQKLLGNLSQGFIFVLSAPAGTGKTTLVRMLSQEFPCIVESVSCTTRPPRPGEVEGKDYFFLSREKFEEKIRSGDFLEYAEVFGYYYGTSKSHVLTQREKGFHVFLVIDTQGATQLREMGFPAIYVFLSPPSLERLKERLTKRQTESEEVIEKRLSWAEKEMAMVKHYDYHIVNDNLEQAYAILRSIIIAEEHRINLEEKA
ncbi:MAG: guanylate kinase [Verrucomicrobia bacterium]|nr:guanylate kinase [Verrucomicrobiota bacterium]